MNKEHCELLERENFKKAVFARDGGKCVFCDKEAVDAHHIIDRALWHDGGYYVDNGASVCSEHHLESEKTNISVEDVREACGITNVVVPENMDPEITYDKWGNEILANGTRMKGEMFFKPGVNKLLTDAGWSTIFTDLVKYPRTPHMPGSPGATNDDKILASLDHLYGKYVVISEKMDGENTSLYRDTSHARSLDSQNHESRNLLKQFHAQISYNIPERWRVCGENVFAKHSIAYNDLEHHFLGFSIWNDQNECLSWEETEEWFELLGITSVPVLFKGILTSELLKKTIESLDLNKQEGVVIRVSDGFQYNEFNRSVAKYVRKGHVSTNNHWKKEKVVPNHWKKESR